MPLLFASPENRFSPVEAHMDLTMHIQCGYDLGYSFGVSVHPEPYLGTYWSDMMHS